MVARGDHAVEPGPAQLVHGVDRVDPKLVVPVRTVHEDLDVVVVHIDVLVMTGDGAADVVVLHTVRRVEVRVVPQEGDAGVAAVLEAVADAAEPMDHSALDHAGSLSLPSTTMASSTRWHR